MHKVLSKIISKLRKEPFSLDEQIPLSYLFGLIITRLISLIRGIIFGIPFSSKGSFLFIGKNVSLSCTNKLKVGKSVTFEDFVEIDALSENGIIIGSSTKIGKGTIIRCTGSIQKLGKGVEIGSGVGIADYCFFGAAGGIKIGNNVIMGQSVRFHSQNHNFDDLSKAIKYQGTTELGIEVGDDCWVGSGVVFLDGVKVGSGCVIGANTLVNRDIPDYSIAVGNPVKVVKNRRSLEID